MSVDIARNPVCGTFAPSAIWRWCALGALMLIEVLVLTIRFDTAIVYERDETWAAVLSNAPLAGQFLVAIVTALVVFSGHTLRDQLVALTVRVRAVPFPWLWLVGHLLAFPALILLSSIVFEGQGAHQWNVPAAVSWVITALLWLLSWVAAVVPLQFWPELIAQSRGLIALSALATAVALVAGRFADQLWTPLAAWTFWLIKFALSPFYSDLFSDSDALVIGTSRFSAAIAPQCSGYEGIGLVTVFLGLFLWCFRKDLRFPRALILLPIAICVIWVTNAFRVAALIAIGSSISAEMAAGGFHSLAGWIAFNAVALGFVAVSWKVSWFRREVTNTNSADDALPNAAAPYLVPFLVLIATGMLTGMLSTGFDGLYGIRVILSAVAMFWFAKTYRRQGLFRWTWSWVPFVIGAVVFTVWMELEPFYRTNGEGESISVGLTNLPRALMWIWLGFRALGSVCIVPIAEELAFRGYLMRRLISVDFDTVPMARFSLFSFVGSSVIFGLLHGRWLAGSIAGALFAVSMYRRGNLIDAVVAHATANALITTYVLATGDWSAWS